MRKIAIALAVLMPLIILPHPAQAATTGTLDYLTYSVDNEEVTITGCDTSASGTLIVPDTIEGYPVTVIGKNAFNGCSLLTSVILPDTVRELCYNSFFKCTKLTAVELPDSLEIIDSNAFLYCNKLTELVIPKNYSGITGSTVRDTGITAFEVEEGHVSYTTDENGVLFNKDKTVLVAYPPERKDSYSVPDGVTEIGYGAFITSKVSEITLPDSLTVIEDSAFAYTSIQEIHVPAGVRSIGAYAFRESKLIQFEVPPLITEIRKGTFYMCDSLKRVVFHSGVSLVEKHAFWQCGSLDEIVFPHTALHELTLATGSFLYLSNSLDIYVPDTEDINPAISGYSWNSTELQYVSLAPEQKPEEELEITVNSAVASVTAPEGGWQEGSNTFSVSGDTACVVAVSSDGGNTYIRLKATATGTANTYQFTADNVTSETIIEVLALGDVNGDGGFTNADVTMIRAVYAGKRNVDALRELASDVNGDGSFTNADVTMMRAAYAGKSILKW